MQLKIPGFKEEKSTKERIEESIASDLTLKLPDNFLGLQETLASIFEYYELEKGVFKLKDEKCEKCKSKLRRKGTYDKEIILPGGARMLLVFHQYSCQNCKAKVNRRLGDWFNKGDRYSSNVKADAVRLYLSHLSSYDAVKKELIKIYNIPSLSKRTVRKWLFEIGARASNVLKNKQQFSGHFIYDEEYMKVFLGDVGKRGSKLTRVDVYLLLFRDAITQNVIIMLSDSLDKSVLKKHWSNFAQWITDHNITWLTLASDGKREYNSLVDEINTVFNLNVSHAYCIFHFKKNLFEVCNYYLFGSRQTKKKLPKHVINQIKLFDLAVDAVSVEDFEKSLSKLKHEIQTFIPPLQDQIKRLLRYRKNYSLQIKYPFLRTTNLCEQWFGQTKPEKIKKGYKSKKGLLKIVKALAVKILHENYKDLLNIKKDYTEAVSLLTASLKLNVQILPA